jgi:hypothetical protein
MGLVFAAVDNGRYHVGFATQAAARTFPQVVSRFRIDNDIIGHRGISYKKQSRPCDRAGFAGCETFNRM